MNTRYFDHKIHANSSARKMISALRGKGMDTKGLMADEVTDRIIKGLFYFSIEKLSLEPAKKEELNIFLLDTVQMRNRDFSKENFDEAVNLLASSFKEAGTRNDYQFFWNMMKEAMYCVEEEVKTTYGLNLEASTLAYHISNAAKESVGATGLQYASDQIVF